jgi:MHS family proline/betaine transporter-like MFS transporter
MPTYLTQILSPPIPDALLINTLAMVLLGLLIPVYGRLVDRFGPKIVLACGSIALAIIVYPLFLWIDTHAVVAVVVAMAAFAVVHAAVQAASPLTIASMVPTRIRYSAMALGYNVTLAVFGGTATLVATWLIDKTGNLAAPAWYLVACAIIGALTALMVKPAAR